jgi:hypothetical protein
VDGPVTVQIQVTPGSVSVTVKEGCRLLAGDVGAVTPGRGGAVVSSVYVAEPPALVLPAGSVAVEVRV